MESRKCRGHSVGLDQIIEYEKWRIGELGVHADAKDIMTDSDEKSRYNRRLYRYGSKVVFQISSQRVSEGPQGCPRILCSPKMFLSSAVWCYRMLCWNLKASDCNGFRRSRRNITESGNE